MTSGRELDAREAITMGLLDRISVNVLADAIAFASTIPPVRLTADMIAVDSAETHDMCEQARRSLGLNDLATSAIIDAVEASVSVPFAKVGCST